MLLLDMIQLSYDLISEVNDCFDIQGPSTVNYYVDTYDVTASAQVIYETDSTRKTVILFNDTTEVKVYKSDVVTLIQTDKPIYKPGQTVQFRVMTLDFDFMPDTKGVTAFQCFNSQPYLSRIIIKSIF